MNILRRTLPSLTLFEWGGILTYFYFSGRIASFLHPIFRPWVLVTGLLLIMTALCVAFFPEDSCSHTHDHEHGHDHDDEGHSHGNLTFGSVIAFFLLLVPFALAAKVSPDSYGADLIERRGLVEDIRSLPSMSNKTAAPVVAANPPAPATEVTPEATVETTTEPVLPGAGGNVIDPPSPPDPPPSGQPYRNPALQPNKSGNIPATVTDLLLASQDASTRADFEGKRVEIVGQFLPPKKGEKQPVLANGFMLVRLVMVCCAADMMPVALKIETAHKPANLKPTSWLKVVGTVHYRPRAEGPGPDGIDYGSTPEPVIGADSVTTTPAPAEKYVY